MSHDVPIGATQVSLAQLNERSRDIFRQIVESYLATGEPVGSRNISRLIATPLSPASVRNVMSDLEQLGLVYAPHTSAGRLPTEVGLRFFVDALMEIGDLGESDRRDMEAKVAAAGKSMEAVLNEASGMLSGLTRAAGRGAGREVERASQAHRVRAARARARAGDPGRRGRPGREPHHRSGRAAGLRAHRGVEFPQRACTRPHAGRGQNRAGEGARRRPGGARSAHAEDHRRRLGELVGRGERRAQADRARRRAPARRPQGGRGPRAGASLFDDLETKRGVVDLLGRAERADGARIFIGSENKLFSLSGSSTIVAPYRDGAGRIVGVIGVIGPTRLNYARVIPMVDYTAKVVSKLIGG